MKYLMTLGSAIMTGTSIYVCKGAWSLPLDFHYVAYVLFLTGIIAAANIVMWWLTFIKWFNQEEKD